MASSLHVQERDLRILSDLGELGVLDTETIHGRHFPDDKTGRACQRRLRLYVEHGLTKKVSLVVSSGAKKAGRLPTIHCLTPRGADLLEAEIGVAPRRVSRSDPRPFTLLHRLEIVKIRLALDDATSRIGMFPPQWIMEQDTKPGAPIDAPPIDRLMLCYAVSVGEKTITCRPDASCLLAIPRAGTQDTIPLIGYWEVDRSTESLSQVARKLPGYHALFSQQGFRLHWPEISKPAVRVFFVTISDERRQNIIEAVRTHPGAEFFRFATRRDLCPDRLLTEPIWQTIDRDDPPRAIVRTDA